MSQRFKIEDKFWIVDLITRFTIHDAGGKRTEHRIQTSDIRRQKTEVGSKRRNVNSNL